ncbi:MAG: Stp1/IreP family PP2C-type Ser/Thr phosphatase [Bacteroidota bacterium]
MRLADALEMVVRTDPGMVRSHNEDAVFADPGLGLVILADGMGGYNAGEVASGMATTLLADNLAQSFSGLSTQPAAGVDLEFVEQRLLDEIAAVNLAIFDAAESQAHYAGMGTTLVVGYFHDNRMCVAHLGDSRLYRLRGGRFEQLTRDHSLLQEQLDSGVIGPEEARHFQNKNLLTRALGVDPSVDTEIHHYGMAAGDIVLLCSDGLNDMLDDDEMAHTLRLADGNLELAADRLVRMANERGGRDNISVILVRVRGDYAAPLGWWQKLLARFQ